MMPRSLLYTRDDLKSVTKHQPIKVVQSYSRFVELGCGHLQRLTGRRALRPPKRMYCFECRCERVRPLKPPDPALATRADEVGAALYRATHDGRPV